MEAGPSSEEWAKEESQPIADFKPYRKRLTNRSIFLSHSAIAKFRLGGSRSSVVSTKFLKEIIHSTPAIPLDTSQSISTPFTARSKHQTLKNEKVRFVGRGGAGARLRTIPKLPTTRPLLETDSSADSSQADESAIVRTVGRGGLGSRPKASSTKSKESFELLDLTKPSKRSLKQPLLDTEARSRSSEQYSPASTISTIHFAGESGLPPPNFFKSPDRRPRPKLNNLTELDEPFSSINHSNTSIRSHKRRREGRFPLLFSMFQNTSPKYDSSPTPSSLSPLPSQITLTSIETDPSYFFHGSQSRASTLGGQDTDLAACGARPSSSLSSFPQESSPSTMSSIKKDEILAEKAVGNENGDPSSFGAVKPSRFEVGMLGHSPSDEPFMQRPKPIGPFTESRLTPARVKPPAEDRRPSWTGEWNIGLGHAIRALRELR